MIENANKLVVVAFFERKKKIKAEHLINTL